MASNKSPPPSSPDHVEAEFYKALQRADLDRVMAIWSDDEEISCVLADGSRHIGPAAIRAAFEAEFAGGAVDIQPETVRRLQGHTCAVHSVVERLRAGGGTNRPSAWRLATHVYLKTAQGWRLVAHHASIASDAALEDPSGDASVLH